MWPHPYPLRIIIWANLNHSTRECFHLRFSCLVDRSLRNRYFSIYSSVKIRNQLWPHTTPGKRIWINLNQSYQRMLPYKFELFKRTSFWEDFLKVLSMYSYVKPPIVDLPCPMIWTSLNLPYMMVLSQKWQFFRMIGFKTVFNVNQGYLGTDRKINSRFRTRAS